MTSYNSKIFPAALVALSLGTVSAKAYTNAAHGFSVSPPPSWQTREGVMGTVVVFVAPQVAGQFTPNVNVVVQPAPSGVSLAQLTDASVQQIGNLITNFKLVKRAKSTLGGAPSNQIEYTGVQGKFALHFQQTFAFKNGKAYILTFTDDQKDLASARKNVAATLQSFKFR